MSDFGDDISNDDKASSYGEDSPDDFHDKDELPSWIKFELKRRKSPAGYSAGFIMDDYLVALVNDSKLKQLSSMNVKDDETVCKTSVLAFSLLDQSVQETEIEAGSFSEMRDRFIKYDGNKILKYGVTMACITVESFQPLKVKCEEIKSQNDRKFSRHIAQIHKDCLYVYGEVEGETRNELWSFNFKNSAWKLWETTGEAPVLVSNSFIHQNNLYVCGFLGHLFTLDLNSMTWMTIEQEKLCLLGDNDCAVYKDRLVVLRKSLASQQNTLCFRNLQTKDTWSTFDIETLNKDHSSKAKTKNLMIYKNLVFSLAFEKSDTKLILGVMSLDNFEISAPKSAEEKRVSSLFLNESESDITFKVENQLIPAHSQVLIKKSQYFTNLFSSLDESRQDVIEIKDCESDVFKRYLHFIYQETFQLTNANQAIKLYTLAQKNLQEDLCDKCLNFLSQNIKENNLTKILNFAHQEKIQSLQFWCLKFFKDQLNIKDVAKLIKNFSYQKESYFKEDYKKFRNLVWSFLLDNFLKIYQMKRKSMQVCESFILDNIEMDTLPTIVRFLSSCEKLPEGVNNDFEKPRRKSFGSNEDELIEEAVSKTKTFQERIIQLREAVFRFIHENVKTILANETSEDFLIDFIFSSLFLSQAGSDITLKVQDQLIPAHKRILMKKSRYFEKMFNSGMAESKQDVIEITDCKSDVFKEYLRFIYQEKVQIENENKAMELDILADKHLQEDLCEKCVDFLNKTIKEDNVYKILDFAHEQDISKTTNACLKFFKNHLSIKNIAGLVKYLDRQEHSDFKENNKDLRSLAFHFILDHFFDISAKEKGNMQAYESFLIVNIEMDNLRGLVRFVSYSYNLPENGRCNSSSKKNTPKTKDLFDERTIQLKEATFCFIHENVKTVMAKEGFSQDFLKDFILYMAEKHANQIQNFIMKSNHIEMRQENSSHKKKGNGKKRMEPVQDGSAEENPTLKKTKEI